MEEKIIDITSCPVATTNKKVVIAGSINTTATGLHMFVNGQEHRIMGGKFLISLPLEAGTNDFDIMLTDGEEMTVREKRTVFCGTLPPVLQLTELPDVTPNNVLTFSGTVMNPNQIKDAVTLKVNGRPIDLAADGTWTQDFFLKAGTNEFEFLAQDAALRKNTFKKVIEHHPDAPEIFFEGLSPITPTHNISFMGKMQYFVEKTMNIRIHDRIVPVNDNIFSYKTSIRTESTEIPFTIEVNGRPVLKFARKVTFLPSAPELEVEDEVKKVSQMQYRISGSIRDENDVDPVVLVNDREVLPKKGQWSASVTLQYGDNTIIIEGRNNAGKRTVIRKKIFVPIPNPVIVLGEYPPVSDSARIFLNGEVQDELEGIISLTINQKAVKMNTSNKFTEPVPLREGVNDIVIAAVTQDNRRAEKIIRVEYSLLYRLINIASYLPRTASPLFTLKGTVEEELTNEKVAALLVNGAQIPIINDKWEAAVNLKPGENYIQVQVKTESGQKVELQKSVWYDKPLV